MAGLHQRHQADKKAQGLLDGRGIDTQRLPGAPLAGKTPQTHPAAQAKTQVTASREPVQLKYVVLTYGYRRIAAQLARSGIAAGAGLVRKIMRQLGLVHCQPPPWRPATTIQGQAGPIPDLVNRDFTAEAPGQKMVGDITYIPTWEGWAFLATVIDCATRKVIGWAIDDNYKTPLITAAIEMAARNLELPPGAVFHSDRGSNYTSAEFGAVLAGLDIRQSVGRTGICYDNALAESFNAAVKVERVYRTVYPTRKKAAEDIARYIELRYNRTRLHSGLGYRTPQEVHDEYLNRQLAA